MLGIHGSSTRTDAVLVTMDGTLVTEEHAGSSALHVTGFEKAAQLVLGLAAKCCEKVSCRPADLYAVSIGIAGADRAVDRTEFQNHLLQLSRRERFPLNSLTVETDVRISLEAAFASGPGIILIGGTGSAACAKGEDGKIYRVGGWGKTLGDEGGAYALSRDALNAALRAHDGRGARTLLLKYALEHFRVAAVEDFAVKVYRSEADIASFLPMLLHAKTEGDHIAHGILFRGAGELADMVRVLTMQIQPRRKVPVSLLGELLDNENVYSNMVKEKILYSLPQVVVQKPKFPPPFGAVILALHPFEFKK